MNKEEIYIKIPKDFYKGMKFKVLSKPLGDKKCYCVDCILRRRAEREFINKIIKQL